MFGKHKKNQYEQQLAQQQSQANTMLAQALNKPPSALEQAKEKEQTDWMSQTNSPDFDISKVTGMSPYMNLFNRAKSNDLSDQTPLSPGASWGGTPNAGLSEVLKSQGARSREQEAAGGLESAFASKNASIRGETLPFLGYQQDRNMNLWNLLNNRSMGYAGMQGQSMARPTPFQQWLTAITGQAAQGAAAGAAAGGA